ncbi:MAG TPA: aminopeptidase [Phycisphaerales bacterium]|nr:aminopeptidase [Phycisphaerales bacterium]
MRDSRLDKLADVLVRYSTRVKKGDIVAIAGDPVSMPLIEATFEAVLKAGGHPFWAPRSESLAGLLLEHGTDDQLRYCSPIDIHRVQTIDVQIGFWAETNTKAMGSVDPKRVATHQSARKPWFKVFMERAARSEQPGGLRWVGTLFPTSANAQDAEMSLRAYEDFVFRAGLLHLPDPVGAWKAIFEKQERVREYLQTKKALHFKVPAHAGHDGVNLRVDVSKATWVNCGGLENFPDGEVFAGPTLPSIGGFGVEGHVNYTFPAVYQGREVEGVRLKFAGGRVVDAHATKNEKFLVEMLDQDAGARNLGEIAIGTNYSITDYTRNTLFDEKIGGTFHAAVGAGYPESGSSNESGLHWDMVCEMRKRATSPGGEISADGEVFYRDGHFLPVTGFKAD